MAYRIGIDAGSKTIKIVVLNEGNSIVCSLYRRHHSDILGSLSCALHDFICEYGDIAGSIAITGSAGIGLANALQLPFVQEVIATTRAVQVAYPQADAIIELGGEDAKIVYLTHGMEQRMNATCAGGTGGFIDTIAYMLGVRPEDMNALASKASRIYPIASRCAVFAQTDIRPLLNAGVATTDLAASALDAVVRQTIGGLACGRPIEGTVIFLGGPLEHIPELAKRFRDALDIEEDAGIKPHDAHLFTACGAAILGGEEWGNFAHSHPTTHDVVHSHPTTHDVVRGSTQDTTQAATQDVVHSHPTTHDVVHSHPTTHDVVRGSTQDTTQAAAHPAAQGVARDVSRETISAAKIAHPVSDVEDTIKNVSRETIFERQKQQQNLANENNPTHNVSRETISDKSSVPEITSSTESNSLDVSRETFWNPKCERPILETEKPARIVSRETICEAQKARPDYGVGSDSTRDVSRETISAAKIAHPVSDVEDTIKNVSRETISLSWLEEKLRDTKNPEKDLVCLPPLFESEAAYAAFRERHDQHTIKRSQLSACTGPLYLGIDAGSTTMKMAVINDACELVYADYHTTKGDALDAATKMLARFYDAFDDTLDNAPDDTLNNAPDDTLDNAPDDALDDTFDDALNCTFNPTPDDTLDNTPDDAFDDALDDTLDNAPDDSTQQLSANATCDAGVASIYETTRTFVSRETFCNPENAQLTSSVADISTHGSVHAYIAHACATGYGEDLLRAGLGIDSGVVETLAHVRAARAFQPEVTFVLDIGGQDIKAIWVKNGRVTNAVLNEACSSGCGAFLEETAHALNLTPDLFAEAATHASAPVDLGAKCSVFMTSRVRHAQEQGIDAKDIAAGLAYSVVKNALYRIIGVKQMSELGDHIVVQGGTFMSDAVLRAFELEGDLEVVRPDTAHLMGAIGAALTARMRAHSQVETQRGRDALQTLTAHMRTHSQAASFAAKSTLLSAEKLAHLKPQRTAMRCNGCENACTLSVVAFEDGRCFISGNRCERAYECVQQKTPLPSRIEQPTTTSAAATTTRSTTTSAAATTTRSTTAQPATTQTPAAAPHLTTADTTHAPLPSRIEQRQHRPPNAVAVQQHLLAQYGDVTGSAARGSARIGYLNTLSCYERTPFWHTLLKTLGFSLIIPRDERAHANGVAQAGLASIPSESVCFPAKLSHMRLYDVVNEGAQAAFMPYSSRGEKCAVTTTYTLALKDSSPLLRENKCTLIAPELTWPSPTIMRETGEGIPELLHSLNVFTTKAGVTPVSTAELLDAFDAGLAEQIAFADAVQKANERVLAWSEHTQGRIVLLAGRPYHMDPAMLHDIDKILVDVGFGVLSQLRLREIFKQEKKSTAEERVAAKLRQAKPVDGETPWMPGKHFRRLASLAIKHPQIELVCLQSFGCGYDSVSLMEAREMMEAAGRAFTALKIDDITDTAHIRIRLRTLAETVEDEAKSPTEAVKREEKHLLRSRKAPQARTRTATKPAEATAETVEDER